MTATTTAPLPAVERQAPKTTATPERLFSLDVFRGLTMLLLISHGFGIHDAFKDNAAMGWLADSSAWRAR